MAALARDAGTDRDIEDRARILREQISISGVAIAGAVLELALCFHHAVRDDHVGADAGIARLRDLTRGGCQDAQRVGGRGDLGADVKATDPYGRRWVIQCKRRRNGAHGSPVGTPDLQVLNGTALQVHGADVAVLVTNGRVTGPAVTFAKQQRLHVVDRQTLAVWASGSRPLWELLRAVPPPRRPTSLS
ncbi:restriction endonuclease [Streptomyces sp. ME03-5684b]|uniref:restriction endonuclease n=1 Tax=Streptomyces sp. ME03-5684b TaxID=3028681 RepID=UPI0029B04CC6|nr:restriction endonuclease [Streptomyces sp. ME03-5684b]MDX3319785.1 restriction endonuclease [Streptomyces sp. ME03-5684b]